MSTPKNSSHGSTSNRTNCMAAVFPTMSFDNEETDDCFGYDEFGIPIPWSHQIGDAVEVLGNGRSGQVAKVLWGSKSVALKTFSLDKEDDRSLQSVYEHELEVFTDPLKLWGTYVPMLLFNKPWATSPLIGMELGEPLPDDMTEWAEADRKKADETVYQMKEHGWHQKDVRGANFVRLKGDRIAMVDFESMERVVSELTNST